MILLKTQNAVEAIADYSKTNTKWCIFLFYNLIWPLLRGEGGVRISLIGTGPCVSTIDQRTGDVHDKDDSQNPVFMMLDYRTKHWWYT